MILILILILISSFAERGNGNGRMCGNGSADAVGKGFLSGYRNEQNKMLLITNAGRCCGCYMRHARPSRQRNGSETRYKLHDVHTSGRAGRWLVTFRSETETEMMT